MSEQPPIVVHPAPPSRPSPASRIVPLVIAGVAVVLLAGLGLVAAIAVLPSVAQAVEPHCSVGVYGLDVNLTMKGWQANRACDAFIKGFNEGAEGSTTAYRSDGPGDGTVMCEYNVKGVDVVVRDKGALKLVGNMACQTIRQKLAELNGS